MKGVARRLLMIAVGAAFILCISMMTSPSYTEAASTLKIQY